jgi:hypothetical protein
MVHPTLPIAPGEILAGKYRVESVLGRGGMGIVYAATHVQLEQRVAIKVLVEGDSDPEMRERFAREARAASKIRSEHVARVLDVGALDSGIPYTVMEYLAGQDLARTLRDRGVLPVTEAVGYVLQACEALAEAHVAGIVHRDLKPANVFLARRADGSIVVKLLDFGISKLVAQGANGVITNGTTVFGSPAYMPPEQLRSARDVDARGDVWSLGATLFELIAGRPPFRADTLPELCVRILEEPAPELVRLVPDAPPGLSALLQRCLAKERAARVASVAELTAALEPFGPAEGRVSVERVARILGQLGSAPAACDPETAALQDAATVKPRQVAVSSGSRRQPAEKRSSGRLTAAGVAFVVVALGFAALRVSAAPHANAAPALALDALDHAPPTSPPAMAPPHDESPIASSAPPPMLVTSGAPSRAAAPPRKVPNAAHAPLAGSERTRRTDAPSPAPVASNTTRATPAESEAPRSGTEGFGDRK